MRIDIGKCPHEHLFYTKLTVSGYTLAVMMFSQGAVAAQNTNSNLYYKQQLQNRNIENCSVAGANCAIPVNNHGCRIVTARAEGNGLENTQRLVKDALFNLLDSRGLQVTMTSVIQEPDCFFMEVGNKVRCDIEASICN